MKPPFQDADRKRRRVRGTKEASQRKLSGARPGGGWFGEEWQTEGRTTEDLA